MKKDELIAKANDMKLELTGEETVDQLKEKIDAAEAAAKEPSGPEMTLRKNNRGTKRRLRTSLDNLHKALDEFARDMDELTYVADEEGNKVGKSPLAALTRAFRNELTDQVNKLLA